MSCDMHQGQHSLDGPRLPGQPGLANDIALLKEDEIKLQEGTYNLAFEARKVGLSIR